MPVAKHGKPNETALCFDSWTFRMPMRTSSVAGSGEDELMGRNQDEQKFAFITGAASGIGRATAERFASEGWWVGAADVNGAGLETLRDALGKDRCRLWHLDVRDKVAYDAVVAELAEETGGRLDLLFNNAGIGAAGFFEDIPLDKATPGSLCFTTSSSAATYGAPSLAVYTATKFAVKGLTEALAVELSRCDVRVADVLPGVIDTAIFEDSPVYVDGQKQPTGGMGNAATIASDEGPFRLIQPSEVADAVWRCYEGENRLHWYVPEDVEEIEKAKTASPESQRDARIALQEANLRAAAQGAPTSD
jgi:NAD(P)-dependent dehydrogenase (short-subunit alcohol dehydrogenase family)